MEFDEHDVIETASTWVAQGKRVALATVVNTWGSSPCPVGSQLVVDHNAQFVGSVSGGCIESAVIQAALEVMETRTVRTLEFGVSNERAWEVGLACGGTVHIFLEPVGSDTL